MYKEIMSYTDQLVLAIVSACLVGLLGIKHFIKNPKVEEQPAKVINTLILYN